jgi:hypothetical protein
MSRLARLLVHSALVERRTERPVSGGGLEAGFATVAQGVPCRVSSQPAAETRAGAARWAQGEVAIYFEPGRDVQRHDRVTVGSTQYDVLSAGSPSVSVYRVARAREIQHGAVTSTG